MAIRIDAKYEKIITLEKAGSHYNFYYEDPFSKPYSFESVKYNIDEDNKDYIIPGIKFPYTFKYNKNDDSVEEIPYTFKIIDSINNTEKEYISEKGKAFNIDESIDNTKILGIEFENAIYCKTIGFIRYEYDTNFNYSENYVTETNAEYYNPKFYPYIGFTNEDGKEYTIYRTVGSGIARDHIPESEYDYQLDYAVLVDNSLSDDKKNSSFRYQMANHRIMSNNNDGINRITINFNIGLVCDGVTTAFPDKYGNAYYPNKSENIKSIKIYNYYDHYYRLNNGEIKKFNIENSKSQFFNLEYTSNEYGYLTVISNYSDFGLNFNDNDYKYISKYFNNEDKSEIDVDIIPALSLFYDNYIGDIINESITWINNLGDDYPYTYKKTEKEIKENTIQLKDKYSNIDRWFRCITVKNGDSPEFRIHGNTNPKFVAPINISSANPLILDYNNKDYSIHLKEKLVFDYPQIFQSLSGKNCFNDGFFHFRIRLSSIPTSGDIRLAQFCGVTVGYGVSNSKFFISPYSVYSNTFANYREEATNTTTINTTDGFSVDIVVLDKQYGVYIDRQLTIVSSNNFLPVVDSDNSIKFSDPIINPNVEYDIDDILVCFTRCDSLIGKYDGLLGGFH